MKIESYLADRFVTHGVEALSMCILAGINQNQDVDQSVTRDGGSWNPL